MNREPRSAEITQALLCTNWNKDKEVSHLGVGTGSAQQAMSLGLGQPEPPSSPRLATGRMGQVATWVGSSGVGPGLSQALGWRGWVCRPGSLSDHRTSRSRPGGQKVSSLLSVPPAEQFLLPPELGEAAGAPRPQREAELGHGCGMRQWPCMDLHRDTEGQRDTAKPQHPSL